MLFLHAILFFVLGTSVAALPTGPTPLHLPPKQPGGRDQTGYWISEDFSWLINIKSDGRVQMIVPDSTEGIKLEKTKWTRAKKGLIQYLHGTLTPYYQNQIPEEAPNEKLEITRVVLTLTADFKLSRDSSPKQVTLHA